MNDENLRNGKATQFQTGEKQARTARKGGIASGVAKRKRKAVRQAVLDALYSDAPSGGTEMEAGIAATIRRWQETGDPKCFDILMIYGGQSPDEKRRDSELKLKREDLELRKLLSSRETDTSGQEAAIRARLSVMEQVQEAMKHGDQ